MKKNTKWLVNALAVASSLMLVVSAQAQYTTNVLTDFANFNLSATYGQWDQDGSQLINGGNGYTPTITSGSTSGSYEINAEGYGSGAYNFATPIDASGATMWELTFTLNSPTSGPYWMNPGVDISDGTHQVSMVAANAPDDSPATLDYGNYNGGNTYMLYGYLSDGNGAPLDTSDITAFNLEFDPAGYGSSAPYDITYGSLVLLTPVPEPTTLALAGLSALGLFAFRRRK